MKKIFFLIAIFSTLFAKDVKELYENCSTCHGPKAQEQALGKTKIIAKLSKEDILIALKAYKEGSKNETGLSSIMQSQVHSLDESDMKNLAEYISEFDKKEK